MKKIFAMIIVVVAVSAVISTVVSAEEIPLKEKASIGTFLQKDGSIIKLSAEYQYGNVADREAKIKSIEKIADDLRSEGWKEVPFEKAFALTDAEGYKTVPYEKISVIAGWEKASENFKDQPDKGFD
jgi:hypothetical protein